MKDLSYNRNYTVSESVYEMCSKSLILREMQTKTTIGLHSIPTEGQYIHTCAHTHTHTNIDTHTHNLLLNQVLERIQRRVLGY